MKFKIRKMNKKLFLFLGGISLAQAMDQNQINRNSLIVTYQNRLYQQSVQRCTTCSFDQSPINQNFPLVTYQNHLYQQSVQQCTTCSFKRYTLSLVNIPMKRGKSDRCMLMELLPDVLSIILKKAMHPQGDLTKEPISKSIESFIKTLTRVFKLKDLRGDSSGTEKVNLDPLSTYSNVTFLNMAHLIQVIEKDVMDLTASTTLTKLNLPWFENEANGEKVISSLSKFVNLTSLDLTIRLGNDAAKALSAFTKLTSLRLHECAAIEDSFFPLSSLVNLTFLDLRRFSENYNFDETHDDIARLFSFLPHLTKMTFLNLSNNAVNSDTFIHFSTLTNLTSLNLKHSLTMANCLADLPKLTRLTKLNLTGHKNLSDNVLSCLSKFTNLTDLNLDETDFTVLGPTDAGLSHFSAVTNLTKLFLACNDIITDNGIKHLSSLTKLTSLGLPGLDQITGDSFHHLSRCNNLMELILNFCDLSDADIAPLSHFTNLTSLQLMGGEFTDVALSYISGLTNLKHLCLKDCTRLTSLGLFHLSNFKKLDFPWRYGKKEITQPGFDKFMEATSLRIFGRDY